MAGKVFRILSMDGGDGRVTANLLQQIAAALKEKGLPNTNFLASADLMVGASAGGINSLLLSSQKDPDAFLDELATLWNSINASLLPIPLGQNWEQYGPYAPWVFLAQTIQNLTQAGLGLLGLLSIFNNAGIRNILSSRLGNLTLADLQKMVCIVSFQLDNQDPINRSWVAKVFENLPRSEDLEELCIDVSLRTSAQPVELPIFESVKNAGGSGYIDGAYVANNPGMVALGQLANLLQNIKTNPEAFNPVFLQQVKATAPAPLATFNVRTLLQNMSISGLSAEAKSQMEDAIGGFEKVMILSVGAGVRNMFPGPLDYLPPALTPFINGSAPWGYGLWMFNPLQPLLLLNIFLQSASNEVDFQASNLIGQENYFRLNPRIQNARYKSLEQLKEDMQETGGVNDAQQAADWLVSSGWLEGGPGLQLQDVLTHNAAPGLHA